MKIIHIALAIALLPITFLAAAEPSPTSQPASYNGPKDTRRHDKFVEIAKAGGVDIVFFGDSITDYWRRPANKVVWDKYFAPLKAVNFGIAGEVTKNLHWRVQNGELEGIHPKLIVLLIGTNNVNDGPVYMAGGIKEIISAIQAKSPGTRILLLAIFPRGGFADKITKANQTISTYAFPDDPKRVIFMDLGQKFLNADGTINKELMPDTLHLSPKGFEVWAEAIIDTVKQQLQDSPNPAAATSPTTTPDSH